MRAARSRSTVNHFRLIRPARLSITWSDTTSGNVAQSEVQWGALSVPPPPNAPCPPPNAIIMPAIITRHGDADGQNTFTTPPSPGLTAAVWYAFRVRDYDVPTLVATQWSPWTPFQAVAGGQIELVISYAGADHVLAVTSADANGNFSEPVPIPADVPPNETYPLRALLSGVQVASTPVYIQAAGQPLPPAISVIDSSTGQPKSPPAGLVAGSPFILQFNNFGVGAVIVLTDTLAVLGTTTVDPLGSAISTFVWPPSLLGPHAIIAQQGSSTVSLPVLVVQPAA